MLDSEVGARRMALASRDMRLGRYIAELLIPLDQPAAFGLWTTEGSRGHYDVTATPETLLACVARVIPV